MEVSKGRLALLRLIINSIEQDVPLKVFNFLGETLVLVRAARMLSDLFQNLNQRFLEQSPAKHLLKHVYADLDRFVVSLLEFQALEDKLDRGFFLVKQRFVHKEVGHSCVINLNQVQGVAAVTRTLPPGLQKVK